MLTPEQLDAIVDTMYPLLDELNTWISDDMISRLMARMGRGEEVLLTGSDQWQAELYQAVGGHMEALQKKIRAFTKLSDAEIAQIFQDAAIKAWTADDIFYTAHGLTGERDLSEGMVNILQDGYERTLGTVRNFTRTTATASQSRLIQVLDQAYTKVITGAQSYTSAVRQAVNDLARTQTRVRYDTGHNDTIETAVLRAVRTGTAQATGNMSMQGMADRDWDLIRVSAHLGARYGDGGEDPTNHFWWQGKLYSRTGRDKTYPDFEETTGYGTGEGLCGWNCRHSFGPGDPDHDPYAHFDAAENKQAYDLSQKQRSLEARIRKQKREVLGLQTAIDGCANIPLKAALEQDHIKAAVELQRYNTAYNEFCEEHGLKKLSDRISIAQWDRSTAARATAAARKA